MSAKTGHETQRQKTRQNAAEAIHSKILDFVAASMLHVHNVVTMSTSILQDDPL